MHQTMTLHGAEIRKLPRYDTQREVAATARSADVPRMPMALIKNVERLRVERRKQRPNVFSGRHSGLPSSLM